MLCELWRKKSFNFFLLLISKFIVNSKKRTIVNFKLKVIIYFQYKICKIKHGNFMNQIMAMILQGKFCEEENIFFSYLPLSLLSEQNLIISQLFHQLPLSLQPYKMLLPVDDHILLCRLHRNL